MGSINNLSSSHLQSLLSTALQDIGSTNNTNPDRLKSSGTSSVTSPSDSRELSPFARLISRLQQLQQSDPAKYKQVTQQIATDLQSAAQTAQADGNSTAANQLTQLSKDFSDASSSGQLPNIQDLAQAVRGHHHHHHAHHASADADSRSSASSLNQSLSQFLSAIQAGGAQNSATDPLSIILNALDSSGLSTSNAG
jgi:hypothetical protein